MNLVITRRRKHLLSDGTYLLAYEAIDYSKRSRTENCGHYSALGLLQTFFEQTHIHSYPELDALRSSIVTDELLYEDVSPA